MARAKTTVYLDPDVLRAMRIRAARTGKRDSDVVEEALREFLGLAVIDRVRARSNLSEDEAMALANQEVHAARRERRRPSRRR
jgi:plasmid stability protein